MESSGLIENGKKKPTKTTTKTISGTEIVRYVFQFFVPLTCVSPKTKTSCNEEEDELSRNFVDYCCLLETLIREHMSEYIGVKCATNIDGHMVRWHVRPVEQSIPNIRIDKSNHNDYCNNNHNDYNQQNDNQNLANHCADRVRASLSLLEFVYIVESRNSEPAAKSRADLHVCKQMFYSNFSRIKAFIRFILRELERRVLRVTPSMNISHSLSEINDNFLNFKPKPYFDAEDDYRRLLDYGVRSAKIGALIREIETQLRRLFSTASKHDDNCDACDRICVAFNGGKDCTVILHAVATLWYHFLGEHNLQPPPLQLLLIEQTSAPQFPQMEQYLRRAASYYRCRLSIYRSTDLKSALHDVRNDQPRLQTIFMGVRRSDIPESARSILSIVQPTDVDRGWPPFLRISPILDWSYSDVWRYIIELDVPYCPLYDSGYTSIGSTQNTIPNERLFVDFDVSRALRPFSSIAKSETIAPTAGYYLPAFLLRYEQAERDSRVEVTD